MSVKLQQAILAVSSLPTERQEQLAELLLNHAQPVIEWGGADD